MKEKKRGGKLWKRNPASIQCYLLEIIMFPLFPKWKVNLLLCRPPDLTYTHFQLDMDFIRWWPWHISSESQHRWHRSYSVNSFAESKYYNDNQLKANPAKTQVSLFHLRNREVGRKLSLTWNGVDLKHCDFPVYLGVTLDRTLSYKQHIEKVKGKVRTRNNLLHKLANSSWGANTSTLRAIIQCPCTLLFSCRICLSCVGKIIPCKESWRLP